jgi:hypothetical protein
MKPARIITIISLILIAFGLSSAEIYTWVDENGVTHYSDSPTSEQLLEENDYGESPRDVEQAVAAPEQPAPASGPQERNELMKSITKLLEDSEPMDDSETGAGRVELYVTDT